MKILPWLVALVLFLLASSAEAGVCDKGDQLLGQVCVHVDAVQMPQQEQPYSTVYRVLGSKRAVVWEGFGLVETASRKRLVVSVWGPNEDGVTGFWSTSFLWNGRVYGDG